MRVARGSALTVGGCTFTDNGTTSEGGAIHVASDGSAVISGSNFESNFARIGSAVYVSGGGTLELYDNDFVGKDGASRGGIGPVVIANREFLGGWGWKRGRARLRARIIETRRGLREGTIHIRSLSWSLSTTSLLVNDSFPSLRFFTLRSVRLLRFGLRP